jgi:NAD(P)-dependent dehydrogenase (short-subunit alcohol dehydrogenase family)
MHGCHAFTTAQNLEKAQHLTKAGIESLELDVLDAVSCKMAAEWVSKVMGGTLNILVNNFGVCGLRSWDSDR